MTFLPNSPPGIVWVLGALLVFLVSVFFPFFRPAEEGKKNFVTAPITRGPIVRRILATGTVQPKSVTKVSTQLSGRIAEIFVDFNDAVNDGQVLARLDPASFEARFREAEAHLEVARAELLTRRAERTKAEALRANKIARRSILESELASKSAENSEAEAELGRMRRLSKKAMISESELVAARTRFESSRALLEAAEARLKAQDAEIRAAAADVAIAAARVQNAQALIRQKEAALSEAKVNLERSEIRSPMDGIVLRRDVEVGQTVAASLHAPTLFTLAGDLSQVKLETWVDEADIGSIRRGQKTVFSVDAYPKRSFSGTVRAIHQAPEMLQNVVTYTVIVTAENPGLSLLPGMTAVVYIAIEEESDALRLPNAALRFAPQERSGAAAAPFSDSGEAGKRMTRVWVLGGDKRPLPVDVQTGPADDLFTTLVGSNLKEGDRVITGYTPEPP